MKPIRLIAMDMDGTLLTRIDPVTACIPQENAALLRQCREAGIHLALASGRMPDDAGFYAADAGVPMHVIGLNGGIILERPFGKPLAEHYLPEAAARRILSLLMAFGVDVAVFGAWKVVSMRERPLSWAQRELGTWFGRHGGRLEYCSGGADVEALLPQVGKIVSLTETDRDGLAAAKARIRSEFPEVEISSSWWNNFEVNPAGVDKGAALRTLAAQLDIPMAQVMAIGDQDNDIPMLRAAGYGVAMGNANAAAKAAADFITLPNDQMGVAAAIRALVLGEAVPGFRHA